MLHANLQVQYTTDTSSYCGQSGVYFVTVSTTEGRSTRKVVVFP